MNLLSSMCSLKLCSGLGAQIHLLLLSGNCKILIVRVWEDFIVEKHPAFYSVPHNSL